MAVQFTLSRMFQLVAVVAVLCSMFASLPWPEALVLLGTTNASVAIAFFCWWRLRTALVAGMTSVLIAAALFNSGYGRIAWPSLIAAGMFQAATILDWFLFCHRR
jgi:hypothetical protein